MMDTVGSSKHDFHGLEDENFYEDLFECASNMGFVHQMVASPTLIKAHWNYLRRLVESDVVKNIILWYNINMTNLV